MKIPLPIRLYSDFECIIQPTRRDQKVLFKQITLAVAFYLISLFGNKCYSNFGTDCVKWFVNEMLTLEHEANKYFEKIFLLK